MSQVDIVPLDLAAFYMRAMYVHGGQPSSTQLRTAVVPQRCVIYTLSVCPQSQSATTNVFGISTS